MTSFQDRFLDRLRPRLLGLGMAFILFSVVHGAYGYYKYYYWSYADAVVGTIDTVCNYFKKYRLVSGGDWQSINCEAKEEAAKLIGDGYEFTGKRQLITVVYDAEPGRKTYALLSAWPRKAAPAKLGNILRIRYSPSTPTEVELASDPEGAPLIMFGVFSAFAIGGYAMLNRRKKAGRGGQASSIS